MEKRTCLVTGGTSGVGRAIAASLARRGDCVVITSRSLDSAQKAADALVIEAGAADGDVVAMQLDLADLGSIDRFAAELTRRFDRLHLLSLNAAAPPVATGPTSSGCSIVTAVNYLGHFHLSGLLVDILRASAPARVLTVIGNAAAIRGLRVDIDTLCSGERLGPLRETLRAALLKTMFTLELARRLAGTGVTANAFHPGLVKSGLGRGLPFPLSTTAGLANLVMSSHCPTGEYLASSPDVAGETGGFYERSRRVDFELKHHPPSDLARLWERTEQIISGSRRSGG